MQELEKALKELNCGKVTFEILGRDVDFVSLDWADEVIRKHTPAGWIPVEKKLPEDDDMVLVTCQTKKGVRSVNRAYYDGIFWNGIGSMSGVVAWRPLPEPYRAVESDGEEGDEFGLQKENHREA